MSRSFSRFRRLRPSAVWNGLASGSHPEPSAVLTQSESDPGSHPSSLATAAHVVPFGLAKFDRLALELGCVAFRIIRHGNCPLPSAAAIVASGASFVNQTGADSDSDSESSVVMKDGAITVLADPCVLQIRLSDLIVTRSRQLETLGENFEIHDVPAGFLIFGELEIAMLDGSLDTMWSFSGPDVFFGNNNGPAFALNEDRVVLNDFLGDHFELDFDGNLVVEEMADG